MLTNPDQERLDKATQVAWLLQQDLLELSRAENPLLADIGYTLLEQVVTMHRRLDRLCVVTRESPLNAQADSNAALAELPDSASRSV